MQGQGEVDPMFTNEMIEYESKFYNNALEEDTEKFLLKVSFCLQQICPDFGYDYRSQFSLITIRTAPSQFDRRPWGRG